jgi:hypothetical protein
MAPILGIYASQISRHLFSPSGAYDSIATTTVGAGGTGTITFSSIPSTYKHLQIRVMAVYSAANPFGTLRFNGDSGSVYWWHQLQGNGSVANASAYASLGTSIYFPADAVGSSTPVVQVADVLDYTSTSKNKTIRILEGYDANGSGNLRLASGLWSATPAAITSITISTSTGSFNQYSSFALYGIKGD